jgi:colanic acid/amylovoran biosynthesis glycosyltransferase
MRRVPRECWDRIHVIRCGIDLEFFGSLERNVGEGAPEVLFVGRLAPEKGLPVLIEAAEILVDRGVDLHLVVVGGGPLAAELAQHAEHLPWVTLVGELPPEGVREHLVRASVFCLPSFDEGLPVSIMEAMAVGVPVVTAAVSGIPELAVDGETAIVVPPGNAEALAWGLQRLLTDADLSAQIVDAAATKVAARHDARVNLPQLLTLLEAPSPQV